VAGFGAALILAALAVAVALGGMASGPLGGAVPGSSDLPIGSDPVASAEIVVDVAGAVAQPGVYHLPAGSRVGDAIAAAGGFGPRVAADRVDTELNLAALVRDGDRIIVPSRDDVGSLASGAPSAGAAGSSKPGLIDLNHATREELDTLPGIGLVTADKIIASRSEKPFRTVDELRERGLVGQKTFDKLRPLITVS